MIVEQRDGAKEYFNAGKVFRSILEAFDEVGEEWNKRWQFMAEKGAKEEVAAEIVNGLSNRYAKEKRVIPVWEIRCDVELELLKRGMHQAASTYISRFYRRFVEKEGGAT